VSGPRAKSVVGDAGFRLWAGRSQNLRQLLLRAHREINAFVAAELVRRGYDDIRLVHGRLLENLDRDGNSITVVARRAHMTKQAMGGLARELETKGYLRRVVDRNDKRVWLLCFTAKGWRLMVETFEIVVEFETGLQDRLGSRRFAALRAGLAAMSEDPAQR
jgi:DNA-binding MarR family transcriptional regulator